MSAPSSDFIHPCLNCGACCAQFRVSLHWSETAADLGGVVPITLTDALRQHERVMKGTSQKAPRCIALDAEIGVYSRCSIHPQRPQVCRDLAASWEYGEPSSQCDRARATHGLPVLTAANWPLDADSG